MAIFGFGKKKKLESESDRVERVTSDVEKGIEKERVRRKKKEEKGSPWMSLLLLAFTVIAGMVFLVYGRLTGDGVVDPGSGVDLEVSTMQESGDGKIIFVK